MPRSIHGGRHELGQNFLNHRPTINRITRLVNRSTGSILELGAGDGALTRALVELDRPFTAIEIDEHRAHRLQRALPGVRIKRADALRYPLTCSVIVGNIPFHLTTPILRRLLTTGTWQHAFLITQWEVARKRAGIGGGTMMTAQAAPWFSFEIHDRVPASRFTPRPSVDGGILGISRRETPLIPTKSRTGYGRFVRSVFTGRGGTVERIVPRATGITAKQTRAALAAAGIDRRSLPRDLDAHQWAALWTAIDRR